jgi:1-deoxy-D-xylulose-5-phosphate reductoisomerase
MKKFRNLALAYQALYEGGDFPCILNASNEVVVDAFLSERVGFTQMTDIIEEVLGGASKKVSPGLDELRESDNWARKKAEEIIKKTTKQ